jgi:glycosyltransferase involved in cell wall biosynthesis
VSLLTRRTRLPLRLSLVVDYIAVGGAETLLLNLFRHFDPAVVQPRLICLKAAGPMTSEFEASGFPVDVIGRSGRYDLRTVPRLIRRFRQDGTDVVLVTHCHPAPLTFGRLAAWLTRRANIVAPHGTDNLTFTGRRCLPRHDVETLFISDALVLVASSQGSYLHRVEGVGRYPWRRILEVVIPNGIPLPAAATPADRRRARAELQLEDHDFVVGIVARLAAVKAHEVLFGAVAKLASTHPRLRLVCVGEGEREPELRALVDTLGIAPKVHFTGLRRDVAQLLPGFDVVCLTSRYECAPLAVIEAMAAGVPVIATDCGAVRNMVTDGAEGYIVDVGDVDAIANRIAHLASDADLRTRMGVQGRICAERKFRIEDTAAAFERLLISLVKVDTR